KENFQIEMSLSLEGIGARLMQQLDYTLVASVVPGGPAFKSKKIKKDDRIIGVAQGDEGEFEDVIGWRLDDVVQKIRGPKGSVVRLLVLASEREITDLPDTLRIIRDRIKLEEQSAKAEVIPITEGNETYNLGVINLPSFYIDFDARSKGDPNFKSTTRDVKRLITELQEQGIDGLLMDLRYNGGGSLQEAIDLTGLFIPQGPVVQVRNTDQSVDKLEDDDDATVFYDGPLAVLINRYSASASEIFSGAIQDYERGVIVGENSFGKGTVQNLIDLGRPVMNYMNRMIAYRKSANQDVSDLMFMRDALQSGDVTLGQLKMTLAKFYRVTGSSTQRLGVQPDISFPTPFEPEEFGESSRESALPWDEISSANFVETDNISDELIDKLYKLYASHLETDPDLKALVKETDEIKNDDYSSLVSLNYDERKAASDARQAANNNNDMSTSIEDSEVFTNEENRDKLSEDPYLKEALRLLAQLSKEKVG
ncbi:MAG: carboxy terminal-processing peptidase, partial [Bacteroidota bacterium]